MLKLLLHSNRTDHLSLEQIRVGSRCVPLLAVRNPKTRRYLLRLRADGTARVTIPRGGSPDVARQFVERNVPWLERQLEKLATQSRTPAIWTPGSELLFRGERVEIEVDATGFIRLGLEVVPIASDRADLRPALENHLRALATRELPARLLELAAQHGLHVNHVTVRNQRTRWGSCSRRGNISLNWRLIQTPPFVRDYICLHELAHLRQMNHSERFWSEVARLCPDYLHAEKWLKQNSRLLRS